MQHLEQLECGSITEAHALDACSGGGGPVPSFKPNQTKMIESNTTSKVEEHETKKLEPVTKKRGAIIRVSLGINPGLMKKEIDEIKS